MEGVWVSQGVVELADAAVLLAAITYTQLSEVFPGM